MLKKKIFKGMYFSFCPNEDIIKLKEGCNIWPTSGVYICMATVYKLMPV